MSDQEDFYIGYLPGSPRRFARHTALTAAGLLLLSGAIALIAGIAAGDTGTGTWDTSSVHELTGVVYTDPYPLLLIGPHGTGQHTVILTDQGKHGAHARVAGLHGTMARLSGTLIERDGRTLLELGAAETCVAPINEPGDRGAE